MVNNNDYVFVLCGNDFEEAAASIFVSELREAGLRVKIVGLTAQRISSAHGLTLIPDLTLDQALPLASKTACLIIPYTSGGINRLKNDPRLREFCHQAYTNQTKLVVGQLNDIDIADLALFPANTTDIMMYPDHENLVTFARELVGLLLNLN